MWLFKVENEVIFGLFRLSLLVLVLFEWWIIMYLFVVGWLNY